MSLQYHHALTLGYNESEEHKVTVHYQRPECNPGNKCSIISNYAQVVFRFSHYQCLQQAF